MSPISLTAFPPSGIYEVTQMVTLLCDTPGAKIHYTTDGTRPTRSSPVFDPYKLIPTLDPQKPEERSAHIIRAIAVKGGKASRDVTFAYQIDRRGRDEYVWQEPVPGLYMIRDFDNDKMYLLTGSQRALLIDAGMGSGDLREVVDEFLEGLPLDVVITHGHPDHIAAIGQFQPDCAVYMNHADLPLVRRFVEQMQYKIDIDKIQDLHEGDLFDLGDRRLSAYAVPGHSPGSMVLLDEATGDLFSGDAVGSNRPTIVDALWMQRNPNGLEEYLSSLQVFRAKTAGKVKAIYNGHNKHPLNGDAYLDHLEAAAQALVDRGVEALTPSLRPVGFWQIASGDRLTNPDWAAINVNREKCLSAPPDQIALLSNLRVAGTALNEPFHPATLAYTAQVAGGVAQVQVIATAASSRYASLTINSAQAKSNQLCPVPLEAGENAIEIRVTSPDGSVEGVYTLRVKRGEPKE